jgi:hypothetical protein
LEAPTRRYILGYVGADFGDEMFIELSLAQSAGDVSCMGKKKRSLSSILFDTSQIQKS